MTDERCSNQSCENTKVNVATCSWWSPWLEAAKLKSNEVFQFVKNDLTEISTVVKSEATSVINSTTNAIKDTFMLEHPNSKANTVKKSVSLFLDSVTSALNPLPEDEDQEAITIKNDAPVKLSPLQVKIHELIKNADTFLLEIEESMLPQYNSWLEILDDQLSTEKLTKQLVASPDLHNQYEKLVPQHVTHITFWTRFLFRKALLEDEETHREIKEKREKKQVEKVQWENEDFAQSIELSEEEQIRILTEYEKEKKKSSPPDHKAKTSTKSNEALVDELKVSIKKDLVIVGDTGSSHMSTSSCDTEGKDTGDDWEKDFELEDNLSEELINVK
ncbi:hypothetical protein RUM44_002345 [Polyplax serrata]|uniref:BSD domain-containing protein n=1 Tax=Polyplax serrata TaxID=468196 RepID=A0ABR1APD4_POLSC